MFPETAAHDKLGALVMLRRIAVCCVWGALWALACAPQSRDKELVIAFSLDTPPYVMDKATSGITVDIVRAALEPKGYQFGVRQMPYGELADAVATKGVDAAATVIAMDDGTYYSDDFITFQNFAITKRSSGLTITSIDDLKGKSILAWQNAYEDLGPEFQALFSPQVKEPYREKYHEIADQKRQVELFWKGEADVIVIDESVMKWFTRELAQQIDTSAALEYHRIFPARTEFRVSFRSEQVRDDFNAGLKSIRESGADAQIYDEYLK